MLINVTPELQECLLKAQGELESDGALCRATRRQLRALFRVEEDPFLTVQKQDLRNINKVLSSQKIDHYLAEVGQKALQNMLQELQKSEQQKLDQKKVISSGCNLFGVTVQSYEKQLDDLVLCDNEIDRQIEALQAQIDQIQQK